MKVDRLSTYCAFLLFIGGCQSNKDVISISEINLATKHSGEPNLSVSKDGSTYLSWVEYENDSLDVLQFSKLEDGKWANPKTISKGTDWFVNWADFPSIIGNQKGHLTSHWLQKSTSGTYDYDVRISQSFDSGNTWTMPLIPHRDSINAEHGFVSMLPTPEGKTFAVWLDGRYTKNKENNAMTLRTAEIDREGNITKEEELDNRVCDCCQTDATWTDKGPIVVYRDRSEKEIRDISIVRKINGEWTAPTTLFDDKWKIAGCPVNGPSIDSEGSKVAVAWFTTISSIPKVFVTLSKDYGATFSDPVQIDGGDAIGRVDVILDDTKAIITWMENEKEDSSIKMRSINFDGKLSKVSLIGRNTQSRSSGFPRLVKYDDGILMAWADALDSLSIVRTFKIDIENE